MSLDELLTRYRGELAGDRVDDVEVEPAHLLALIEAVERYVPTRRLLARLVAREKHNGGGALPATPLWREVTRTLA